MLKRVSFAAALIIIILTLSILATHNSKGILFHNLPWLIAIAIFLGVTSGTVRGLIYLTGVRRLNHQPDRHTLDSFLEHWGTAAGIVILIISGFILKAGYSRIFLWNLHFLGLVVTMFFGTYFLVHFLISKKYILLIPDISDIVDGTIKKYLFRSEWKDTGKYLSSQKSAFLVFSLLGTGILITGAIKLAAYYFSVPFNLTRTATQAHDILAYLFVLMLLIHILFAVTVHYHRRLLKSLFTGKLQ